MLLVGEQVIVIDRLPERLQQARQHIGADTLDYSTDQIVAELKERTGGRGPDVCIEAVGMEAQGTGPLHLYDQVKHQLRLQTDRPTALREVIHACRKGGGLFVLGVFIGLVDKLPLGAVMNKGLTVRGAQQHGHRYIPMLLDRIAAGEVTTEHLAAHLLTLEEGRAVNEMFKNKQDRCVRAVFQPDARERIREQPVMKSHRRRKHIVAVDLDVVDGVHRIEHALHERVSDRRRKPSDTRGRLFSFDLGPRPAMPRRGRPHTGRHRWPGPHPRSLRSRRVRPSAAEWLGVPVWVHPGDRRLAARPYRYRPQRNRLLFPLLHPAGLPVLASMVRAGALRSAESTPTRLSMTTRCFAPRPPTVRHVPGHTQGQCVLHLPDRATLLWGDALVTLDPCTGRRGPRLVAPAATMNMAQARRSLQVLTELEASVLLPGHGSVSAAPLWPPPSSRRVGGRTGPQPVTLSNDPGSAHRRSERQRDRSAPPALARAHDHPLSAQLAPPLARRRPAPSRPRVATRMSRQSRLWLHLSILTITGATTPKKRGRPGPNQLAMVGPTRVDKLGTS